MKFFQFWDADPPADVLALMDAARQAADGFEYVRFDARSGRDFVGTYYGARGLAIWDACALPAMMADYLRLLLMDTYGGVYADASYRFTGSLSALVAKSPVAQLPLWMTVVNTNYLMFRKPGDPFLRACIALAMENVEQRRMGSALMAVGCGVLNGVRCILSPEERPGIDDIAHRAGDWITWGWNDLLAAAERLIDPTPELVAAYRAITLVPIDELHQYAISEYQTSHRSSDRYWFKWKGSIYR